MCDVACIIFGVKNLPVDEVKDRRILDIGACDDNGSVRSVLESYKPSEYVGVDIVEGPGVDMICDAVDVLDKFGKASFDIVISMNTLEHIRDWKKAVANIKEVCKPGGTILVAMPSPGFSYHAHPNDFWRFTADDLKAIFDDCDLVIAEQGSNMAFIKVKKPIEYEKNDISDYELYSIIAHKRVKELTKKQLRSFRAKLLGGREILRHSLHKIAKKLFNLSS